MIKNITICLALLLVSMTPILPGCSGNKTDTSDPSVNIGEILSSTAENMRSVDRYRFDTDLEIQMSETVDGDETEYVVVHSMSGAVDNPAQRLMHNLDWSMELSNVPIVSTSAELYIVGLTGYLLNADDATAAWTKINLDSLEWADISSLEPLSNILDNDVFEYQQTEVIDGRRFYVIKMIPDTDKVRSIIKQYLHEQLMYTGVVSSIVDALADNVSMNVWIDKETRYIGKFEIQIGGDLSLSNVLGAGDEDANTIIRVTSILYDFNDVLSIVLPEEAASADISEPVDEQEPTPTYSFRESEAPPASVDFPWEVRQLQTSYLSGIWGFSANDIYAVGANATIFHFDGTDWNPVDVPQSVPEDTYFLGVWGPAPDSIYVCGENGILLHFNGDTWTPMDSNTIQDIGEIRGTSDSDIYMTTNRAGEILHYDGTAWSYSANVTIFQNPENQKSAVPMLLPGIWGTSPDNVYITGSCFTILRWNGSIWETISQSDNWEDFVNSNYAIWGSNPNDIFVSSRNDGEPPWAILHFDGTDWSKVIETSNDIRSMWGTGPDNVFAVGESNFYAGILHYDGKSWTEMGPEESLLNVSLNDIWGSSEKDIYIVGEGGYILHYSGN